MQRSCNIFVESIIDCEHKPRSGNIFVENSISNEPKQRSCEINPNYDDQNI